MTDNMQSARERISDMVLEVLACEPCIGTRESEESFALRIAVAAALRLAAPEWRPIETAPTTISDHTKCGEQVILGGDGWVDTGFYHDGSECYGHRGGAGWFAMDDWGSGLLTASNLHPTHWMPLPAAPTVSAEGEG